MRSQRIQELIATCMIGDGMLAMTYPQQHARLWKVGPRPLRKLVQWIERRPGTSRILGGIEVALGLWWAASAYRDLPQPPLARKFTSLWDEESPSLQLTPK